MFVRYEKTEGDDLYVLEGLEDKKGFIFKTAGFNEFEEKPVKIPEDYKRAKVDSEWVLKYKYDPSKKPLEKNNEAYKKIKEKHSKEKVYFMHDNGGRPFVVYLSKEKISVYREVQNKFYVREKDRVWDSDRKNAWFYIEHVVTKKNFEKVWVGKSISNDMTKWVKTDTKEFLGNSILVKLNASRYLFIGESVFEFTPNEEIQTFYSPVGNNDVPYPYAIGEEYVYFMIERKRLPISEFKEFTEYVKKNAYNEFYENDLEEKVSSFPKIKEIQSRLF
ncbi:MAG TPA: hypothetical protein PKK94_06520 [Leptospiraceae bacterium]|nr:hypothetical protein [Leptospiraceae bacterium]